MKRRKGIIRKQIFDAEGLVVFSEHLKKLRHEAGITQTQLAFEAGISLSQVARIETARINPTLSTVFAITRALDIPLKQIFDFTLPENKKTEK